MKKSEVSLSLYAKMGYYEIENVKIICYQCDTEVKFGKAIIDEGTSFCGNECFRDFNLINGNKFV